MLSNKLTGRVRKNLDIVILLAAFIIIIILMTLFSGGRFLQISSLSSMAYQLPELGLLSLAMLVAMITGGINLSIISSANFTGVVMAIMMTKLIPLDSGTGYTLLLLVLILLVGLLFSMVLGLFNGILIAYVEISPILTTLGTMIFFEGLTLAITKGFVISGFPEMFLVVGNGSVLGIPIPFYIFSVFAVILFFILGRRPFGNYLYMIGSNQQATEYSGINVKMVIVKTYVLSSLYTGLAAVIMMSRFNSANARYGASYLLMTVLIIILGGTNPDGGFGKLTGVIIALFTLQALSSGFNLLGVSSFITVGLWGVLLVLVIYYREFMITKQNRWMALKE